jgi:hypothetical protein
MAPGGVGGRAGGSSHRDSIRQEPIVCKHILKMSKKSDGRNRRYNWTFYVLRTQVFEKNIFVSCVKRIKFMLQLDYSRKNFCFVIFTQSRIIIFVRKLMCNTECGDIHVNLF